MPCKISIFIPVYRESSLLEGLVRRLLEDPYKDKEIFVIIDEPTPESLRLARSFEGKVDFILNGKRKGKVNALNEAVKRSSGEVLLFLDSDLHVNLESKSFLEAIATGLEETDLVDVKKEVIRESLKARLVSYDYLGFNIASWLLSRTLKRCLGLNGATFAIRRDAFEDLGGFRRVVSEDLDIGVRAFLKGLKFKYLEDVKVQVKAPSSWGEWFKQRKRWGIGIALWLKENFRVLIRAVSEYPTILLPSLLLVFPSLPLLMMSLIVPDEFYMKALYIPLLLLSTHFSLLLPPIALTSTTIFLARNLFLSIGSLGVYSFIYYLLAQKIKYTFNPLEFALFYLLYSTLWLMIVIVSIIKVCVLKQEDLSIDWKT